MSSTTDDFTITGAGLSTGDWIRIPPMGNTSDDWFTVTTTSNSFTVTDEWFIIDEYDRVTTLLRNAAHKAQEYAEKLKISRRNWPSRRELRNV